MMCSLLYESYRMFNPYNSFLYLVAHDSRLCDVLKHPQIPVHARTDDVAVT